jgi:hypothetical protein
VILALGLPSAAVSHNLSSGSRIAAVILTGISFGIVLELVRRRRLVERYALLWMLVSLTLLVLAVWNQLLNWLTDRAGFQVPANFLFAASFGVVFVLLLHFSVATSRLSEETKMLAQEVARLDHQLRLRAGGAGNGASPDVAAADEVAQAPSARSTSDQ